MGKGTSVCPAASSCYFRRSYHEESLTNVALVAALAMPALCQNGRLSPDDQHDFQSHAKWVNDSRKNDRDDIAKDVRKMQDIMQRNNIPPDVPYDPIASNGYGPQDRYNDGRYNNAYPQDNRNWGNQGLLSPDETARVR